MNRLSTRQCVAFALLAEALFPGQHYQRSLKKQTVVIPAKKGHRQRLFGARTLHGLIDLATKKRLITDDPPTNSKCTRRLLKALQNIKFEKFQADALKACLANSDTSTPCDRPECSGFHKHVFASAGFKNPCGGESTQPSLSPCNTCGK